MISGRRFSLTFRRLHARQRHRSCSPAGGNRKRGACTQALGRSRGGLSTKIHLACDGRGRPVRVIITPGQANDMPQAERLIEGFRPSHVIADRGYDSGLLIDAIRQAGAEPVIPPHPRRRDQRGL